MTVAIFAGQSYYPAGGANDLVCIVDSFDEAVSVLVERIDDLDASWTHIYDLDGQAMLQAWVNEDAWFGTSFVENPSIDERFPSRTLQMAGYKSPKTYSWWTWGKETADA